MKIKKYIKNEIIIGSLMVIGLTFLGNIFSYLFQFASARLLGPEDYVIVAVITSIIAVFGIPSSAIQTVISHNTTVLNIKNNKGKIKGLMRSSIKSMLIMGTIIFILYSFFAIFLSRMLSIPYLMLFFTGFFIFLAFLYPIMAGIAQGLKKFSDFGINFFLNCFIKFIIGFGLMLLGLRVFGAITGFLAGMFFAFLIFFYNLREIVKVKAKKYSVNIFSEKNLFPIIAMILFVLIFNLDVIFAKRFFSAEVAGVYSVASLLGKIILFGVSSIATVMLPISSENYLKGKDSNGVLKKTIFLSLVICILAIIIFATIPKFVVGLLFGETYMAASTILFNIGLSFSFLSILNILIVHAISTNKNPKRFMTGLIMSLILEVLLFFLFSSSMKTFSFGFLVASALSLLGGLASLWKN